MGVVLETLLDSAGKYNHTQVTRVLVLHSRTIVIIHKMRFSIVLLVLAACSFAANAQYDDYYEEEPSPTPPPTGGGTGSGGGLITPMCDAPAVNSSNCVVPRPALQPHLRTEKEALDLAECYLNCLEMVSLACIHECHSK